jgi:hypothetical protein
VFEQEQLELPESGCFSKTTWLRLRAACAVSVTALC